MPPTSRRFTLSLRNTLLGVFVGLLLATVVVVGTVTYINDADSIENLAMSLGQEISDGMANRVRDLLAPAQTALHEWHTLAKRGMLPVHDHDQLALRFAERLRYIPNMDWLSYGDREGSFAGAWRRREDGAILTNRSWFDAQGRCLMREDIVHADGRIEPLRTSDRWDYDPRNRPFYKLASESDDLAWVPPYRWWDRGGLGVTAALALRDERGVVGVFTADFHLDSLSDYLHHVSIGQSGRVFLVSRDGVVIAGPRGASVGKADEVDPVLRAALDAMEVKIADLPLDQPSATNFRFGGVSYATIAQAFNVPGGIEWVTVMVVPTRDLFGFIERNFTLSLVLIVGALLGAIALSVFLASRITRPLAVIVNELEKVARFELSDQPLPSSRIREIRVVSEMTGRMKASLRSFGRYVPRIVVRELVANGREAQLGVESRELTIFFSDVEGFSRLSEAIAPDRLVLLSNRYFTLAEDVVHRHRGTVDKFIGDGILAFFNAPHPLPCHAQAACDAALEFIAALPGFRAVAQVPTPTRTRIGLQTGQVLVGNMGSENRMQYTVIGNTVNVANGFQALNKVFGTEIIAGEETHDAAGDEFEWRRLDRVALKGRIGGGFAYELLGRRGKVDDNVLRARDRYEQALAAYFNRDFAGAASLFESARAHRSDDRAAAVMIARVQAFLAQPPVESWTGVYNYTITPVGKGVD